MTRLLTAAQRHAKIAYARHHVKLDYYYMRLSSYDVTTSEVSLSEIPIIVRGQIENTRALRMFTIVTESMIQRFTQLVTIPAEDFKVDYSPFVPVVGEKIEWRASSVRADSEAYKKYRVVDIFPRYVDHVPVIYLFGLQDA